MIKLSNLFHLFKKKPLDNTEEDDDFEEDIYYEATKKIQENKTDDILKFLQSKDITEVINQKDNLGNTFLHLALINSNLTVAKRLVELGACINHQNNEGNTPLHFVFYKSRDSCPYENNKEEIFAFFKTHIDINIKNNDGKTLFLLGAYNNWGYIVEYIIERHAPLYQFDINNFNTLQYVEHSKNWNLVEMVIENSSLLELKHYQHTMNENRWFHPGYYWSYDPTSNLRTTLQDFRSDMSKCILKKIMDFELVEKKEKPTKVRKI